MSAKKFIDIEALGGITVIRLHGPKILDEQLIQMIGDQMFTVVDDQGARMVILDFSSVTFMAAGCLGKVLTLHRKLEACGGKLVLCGLVKDILDVFVITKLTKTLLIRNTRDEAVAEF